MAMENIENMEKLERVECAKRKSLHLYNSTRLKKQRERGVNISRVEG